VTLHDIAIKKDSSNDSSSADLILNVTAKTYRYLDEENEDRDAENAG